MAIRVRYVWRQIKFRWDENYTEQEYYLTDPPHYLKLTEYDSEQEAIDALDEALRHHGGNEDFSLAVIYDKG